MLGFINAFGMHGSFYTWLVVLLCFIVLPLLSLVIFIRLGKIESLHVPDRRQRNQLYLLSVIYAVPASVFCKYTASNETFVWCVCIASTLALLLLLNSLVMKVSAHMAAAGGLVLYLLLSANSHLYIQVGSFLIAAMLYWSRFKLNAHTHTELALGLTMGATLSGMLGYWLM